MSGMLAKVLNSTVGTSDFKSLDVALTERIYDKLNSETRLIGSDDVLYYYEGSWIKTDGVPLDSYSGYTTYEFSFSHSGVVLFKTTQEHRSGTNWRMMVYDAIGEEIASASLNDNDLTDNVFFDMIIPMTVRAGEAYSVLISSNDARVDRNLSICATPVICAPTVTLV
jgi:hypothetical protein